MSASLSPPERILLGPGPSNVHPRVLRAMSAPVIGHLDPAFLSIMDETRSLLKLIFQTRNEFTTPMSGTGSAGMETCFVNLIEPGERVVVCVNGVFGERMCDNVERCGGKLRRVEVPWGRTLDPEDVRKALKEERTKLVAVVHAETSTGVRQPIEPISELAREHGALLLVDTVTSLGGIEVKVDEWGVDACYSGTQKCLSCPPGLAPVTFSPKAMSAVHGRKRKVQSWYLDVSMIERYWGQERFYHHTAPISMIYALREALALVQEEGLEARFARHQLNHRALLAGLEPLGIKPFAEEGYRLPMLNSVCVPEGVDESAVRRHLLACYGIEIGGGLGVLKGRIWRIGLMGESSHRRNVLLVLSALADALGHQGKKVAPSAAVEAALAVYGAEGR